MSKHLFSDIRIPVSEANPSIFRHEDLCVKCGQCRRVCEDSVMVGKLYDLLKTGDEPICIHCGQCTNVCPVNSLTEREEYHQVKAAIADPDSIVIFSTSPSVRVGLGESFGMANGSFVEGKMIAALRALGADYVLDTNFSADLTIMEEASELVSRVTKGSAPLPQFTSCCPAWVKFVETYYPQFTDHISSAKSPIGMQGPTIKTYFAKQMGIDAKKIVNVALTPCTAKKFEIRRDEMNASGVYHGDETMRDMDYVITTRELAKWMKEENLNLASLKDSTYDPLMGEASGAGVIFGNTGGVMEAAARTAYYMITGENPPKDFYTLVPLRGVDDVRTAEVTIAGKTLRIAVIHEIRNAVPVLEQLKNGACPYDFIEVMTCRGGCIGGGGQPKTEVPMTDSVRFSRIASLYNRDLDMKLRLSHENPEIQKLYQEFYGKPLGELAEQMLHTTYLDRSGDLNK